MYTKVNLWFLYCCVFVHGVVETITRRRKRKGRGGEGRGGGERRGEERKGEGREGEEGVVCKQVWE